MFKKWLVLVLKIHIWFLVSKLGVLGFFFKCNLGTEHLVQFILDFGTKFGLSPGSDSCLLAPTRQLAWFCKFLATGSGTGAVLLHQPRFAKEKPNQGAGNAEGKGTPRPESPRPTLREEEMRQGDTPKVAPLNNAEWMLSV